MKFKYWALSLLACGGMLSCTSEDIVDNGNNGEKQLSYLAVNIKTTSDPGTRADDYENGTDAENAITKVRFYFFDADGNAFNVDGDKNYKDVKPGEITSNPNGNNVEEVTDAMLVLENVKGAIPTSMVAIINPNMGDVNKSLSDLKAAADYSGTATSGNFVMSNSVYVDGGNTVCETLVGPYLQNSQEKAEANPVDIYVERVLAKVTVDFQNADKDGNKYLVAGSADGEDAVYAEVKGWQVADYRNQSYLLKQISSSWTDTGLGITPWSSADYHRCFWATSTGTVTNNYAWAGITTPANGVVYTQENTPNAESDFSNITANDLTKVIVAVQLVDKNGQPKARYQYFGGEYVSEAAILNLIAPNFDMYYIKTGENTYRPISGTELKFVEGSKVGGDSYKVYPQLTESFTAAAAGEESNLYTKSSDTYSKVTDNTTVNTELKKYYAQVWKDGMAYYYTTIKHLGTSGVGQYGIVRNHVYKVSITDIQGYGTPVYNPDETIDPVTPADDASYLAAKINVLAWRVVSSNVTLGK